MTFWDALGPHFPGRGLFRPGVLETLLRPVQNLHQPYQGVTYLHKRHLTGSSVAVSEDSLHGTFDVVLVLKLFALLLIFLTILPSPDYLFG